MYGLVGRPLEHIFKTCGFRYIQFKKKIFMFYLVPKIE